MSAARARTPRFRPVPRVGLLGLYPAHAVLTGLVVGMLAGPRLPAVVVLLAVVAMAGAMAVPLRGESFAVPAAPEPDAPSPGVARGPRPAALMVAGARVAAVAVAVAVAVLLGAVVADARLAALDRTALRVGGDVRATAVLAEAPRTRSFGTRVAPVRLAMGETVLLRAGQRVRLPVLRAGDEVVVRGALRALRPFEAFERRRGVHAVLEADAVRATGRWRGGPIDRVRRRAEDALSAGLAPEQAALARGMVLGQDQALPDDLREAFRGSGLAHLLAASGQNVMLLAALVLGVLAVAGAGLRPRLACALLAVALYVPLAGAGPSIQRAGIMGAAGLVAALAGRPSSRAYAVLLAAAGTLALSPRAAEDPGWQLSFAAVLAIGALHGPLRRALVRRRTPAPVADVAAMTVAATAGTAPLLSLHFGEVSLVSLPANLLAAPAVAPVMWLGTLAAVLGEEAGAVLNRLAALPLAYLGWLARAAAGVPNASVGLELPGPLAAVSAYAALAVAVVAARAARRRVPAPPRGTVAPLAVAGGAVVALLVPGPPRPPSGPTLSVLDVGQGDAVLLQDGPRAALFDTGPPGAPLVRELRAAGVERLDAVVVTHSSSDHEGGLPALLAAMPVGLVLDGRGPGRDDGGEGGGARYEGLPPGQARGVPAAGQVLRIGRIEAEVLWPPAGEERRGDPNLTAAVVLARTAQRSALLTADAESPVTLPLDLPRVDVLKLAHHGSEDEGLPRLLERLRPSTALIPVGRNTYGHPAPSTLQALRGVPDVRRTDRDGTLRVGLGAR